MFRRIVLACLVVSAAPANALASVDIHASCAAELAASAPTHVRTLRTELTRALDGVPAHYVLDVSLVSLKTTNVGSDAEVAAELRALLTDDHGRVVWQTTTHAHARGAQKDRELIATDAVTAAAHDVANAVRSR